MNVYEMIAFIAYFVLVIGVGIYFFFKSKGNAGEKDYFLGGRDMNGLVAALSAGASDMSAWVLMGLPGAFYATGLSNMWISVGLFIGTACAWIFIAPRLRRFSIAYNDSIICGCILYIRCVKYIGLRYSVQYCYGHRQEYSHDRRCSHHHRVHIPWWF